MNWQRQLTLSQPTGNRYPADSHTQSFDCGLIGTDERVVPSHRNTELAEALRNVCGTSLHHLDRK